VIPIGPILDRLTFWNMPAFVKSYELPVPHHSFVHEGVEVWHVPGNDGGPTVVFCHGNAGNLRFPNVRRDRFLAIHQTGAHLWAFDYRGYGQSKGRPTESGVYEDAVAVHSLARSHHTEGTPFVLFGRSLGGAVATYLATQVETPDSLILESTFTSVPDVCARWTNRRMADLMSYAFNSQERIAQLQCPLYMIHGTADRIVDHSLGEALFNSCPTEKEFISIPGAGHNDLQAASCGVYEETLRRWLGWIR
jgi:uncharacterized protein